MTNPLSNYLPSEIAVNTSPISVKWVESKNLDLSLPFFEQSLKRLKSEYPRSSTLLTTIDQLLEFSDSLGEQPRSSGFIFHSSRCGSTLLSNCIKACKSNFVFSEPQPFSFVMMPPSTRLSPAERYEYGDSMSKLFVALENIYMNHVRKLDINAKVYIKFCSWNIVGASWLTSLMPDSPYVFVFRNPVETIVSLMENSNTGIHTSRNHMELASALTGAAYSDVRNLSDEEYLAAILNTFYKTITAVSSRLCLKLDYKDLTFERMLSMLDFLEIEHGVSIKELRQCFLRYSKDSQKKAQFIPDSELKTNRATESIHKAVQKQCGESYEKLTIQNANSLLDSLMQ